MMKRMMATLLSFVLLAALVLVPGPEARAADEYDALRLHYLETLTGGSVSGADPYVAAKLAAIEADAELYWASQNVNGVWDDYEASSLDNPAYTAYTYRRLKA